MSTEVSVERFNDYYYKVRAKREEGGNTIYSGFSTPVWVTSSPVLASQDVSLSLSNGKNIIRAQNKIHVVYSKNGKVYYRYSSDNGLSWSNPEFVANGFNPTITYDGSKIWVAFVSQDDFITYARRNSANNWEGKTFNKGYDPQIMYAPSGWQDEGIYLVFSYQDIRPYPFQKVCLYWINKNNLNNIQRINYDSTRNWTQDIPEYTIGRIRENNQEKIIVIYLLPADPQYSRYLKYMDVNDKSILVIEGSGYEGDSPFIGNENLTCFRAKLYEKKITVIKYDSDLGEWIFYPDDSSQNKYLIGKNPQIFKESEISVLIFEKEGEIYLQKISGVPFPPIRITMSPENSVRLNFVLRKSSLEIYAQILYSLSDSMVIYL